MRTLDQINIAATDRLAALEAAEFVKSSFPVEQVILFGSKARGEGGSDSDIDLLILTRGEPPKGMSREMWRHFWQIQKNRNVMLSTVVVSMDQWQHGVYQAMLLKSEVERDGVVL